MPRAIGDSVVVITGASSGIGRAAALAFAHRGARVALAARSGDALEAIAAECRQAGGEAIAVATDVTDPDAVEELAERTVRAYGRIDTWVNDAGVIAYGRFDEVPAADFRRVIETNLFGQINGARSALDRFMRQGSGVLINVASVWGRVTSPYVGAYVTSKHAVRAFSDCLRLDLEAWPDIHVSTILPQAVDTPIFDNGANYHGRRVRPIPPLIDAEDVVADILSCALSPRREVGSGRSGRLLMLVRAQAPTLFERITPPVFAEGSFTDERVATGPGNLWEPKPGPAVGGWKDDRREVLVRALADAASAGAVQGLRRLFTGRVS